MKMEKIMSLVAYLKKKEEKNWVDDVCEMHVWVFRFDLFLLNKYIRAIFACFIFIFITRENINKFFKSRKKYKDEINELNVQHLLQCERFECNLLYADLSWEFFADDFSIVSTQTNAIKIYV